MHTALDFGSAVVGLVAIDSRWLLASHSAPIFNVSPTAIQEGIQALEADPDQGEGAPSTAGATADTLMDSKVQCRPRPATCRFASFSALAAGEV